MAPIMMEEELREENARLELQCQAHEKREAKLNAQEAKLNARLAGMTAWEQQLNAKDSAWKIAKRNALEQTLHLESVN